MQTPLTDRILYSTAVVQLLRPLLDFEGFPSSLIEEAIWENAQQGLLLLDEQYRKLYTCRYQSVLQMMAALHLTDVIVRFFPGVVDGTRKDGPGAIRFGMESLLQSQAGYAVAGPFREMLRSTAKECSISVPTELDDPGTMSGFPDLFYQLDDLINAFTRPSYVQPIYQIHRRYVASFSAEWSLEGPLYGFLEPASNARRLRVPSAKRRGVQSLMQIRNLLNTN